MFLELLPVFLVTLLVMAEVASATAKPAAAPTANSDWRRGSVRDAAGKFVMPWLGSNADFRRPTGGQIFQWIAKRNPPPPPPPGTFTVVKPNFDVQEGEVKCTWIGHATSVVQIAGINIITDPVFSERCSPVQWVGPKRYVPPACSIPELPFIHIVLISHDHYDHLDYNSILELEAHFQPIFVCGLELGGWFTNTAKIAKERVIEMDWWQTASLFNDKLALQFLPVQHWSKRHAFGDERRSLWGGYAVSTETFRFFFNGDTGYTEELYEEIGQRCGPFDLAAIPIGAYEPRKVMQVQHINPEEAYLIHRHLRTRVSFGIHFGTFVLTDEPVTEPAEKIRALSALADPEKEGIFEAIRHGASIVFKRDKTTDISDRM